MTAGGPSRRATVGVVALVLGAVLLVVAGVALLRDGGDRGGDDDPVAAGPAGGPEGSSTTSGSPTTTATGPEGEPDGGEVAGTTAPVTGDGIGRGWAPERAGRRALEGFGEVSATVTGPDGRTCAVCLLSATSAEQRARGLMEVTDAGLGGYDGMLFEFDRDASGGFWMKDTPMPLSIAFFDAGGRFVSDAEMEPCVRSSSCPTYPASGPYRLALEVPQGGLDDLLVGPGSTIRLGPRRCAPVAG